ncbi:Sec-independent protein translocase subunit TatA [Lentisalinibacter orientalis]|jgi:sec-independent protein translocase protein TatA|uniref:Sec-independent protein translocase subunit TatA n=1 Tax=Lentisalinibacter orientalis TaxID=2992241 RepID=UPI0038632E93
MLGNISIWQLLIVLLIVIAIFGTKKLRNMGSDVGEAVKGFRSAMDDADKEPEQKNLPNSEEKDADFGTHNETRTTESQSGSKTGQS